jgi:hypothetical protein
VKGADWLFFVLISDSQLRFLSRVAFSPLLSRPWQESLDQVTAYRGFFWWGRKGERV